MVINLAYKSQAKRRRKPFLITVKTDLALGATLKSQPPKTKGKADAAIRLTNDHSFGVFYVQMM